MDLETLSNFLNTPQVEVVSTTGFISTVLLIPSAPGYASKRHMFFSLYMMIQNCVIYESPTEMVPVPDASVDVIANVGTTEKELEAEGTGTAKSVEKEDLHN